MVLKFQCINKYKLKTHEINYVNEVNFYRNSKGGDHTYSILWVFILDKHAKQTQKDE